MRHNVAAVAKTRLYKRTSLKLPSHFMLPKSPSKSKFVTPIKEKKKMMNHDFKNNIIYIRKIQIVPKILASTGSAELKIRSIAQFATR